MKSFKRIFFLFVLVIISLVTLNSCGNDEDSEVTDKKTIILNVYNWGEYISDGFEDSLDSNAAFEE